MANIDAQLGLRPVQSKYGTVPRISEYTRSSTGVIYEGALVYLAEAGFAVYNGTTAAQETSIIGVTAHPVAANDTDALIFDDPDQLYMVQADGNAITTAAAALVAQGRYCNLVSHTAGNTLTGQSKIELDTSEVTSVRAAHDVVQLVRLSSDPKNDVTAANEKWIVKLCPAVTLYTSGRTIVT